MIGGMDMTQREAMDYLQRNRAYLTMREFSTIRGQIRAGDCAGAKNGIDRVVKGRKDYEPRTKAEAAT